MIEKLCHDLTMLAAIIIARAILMMYLKFSELATTLVLILCQPSVEADIKSGTRGVTIMVKFENNLTIYSL